MPGSDAALLQIEVVPANATVYVDGRPVRGDEVWRVEVAPGVSRVEVRADGFLTRRYDAVVAAGDVWSVQVELWPIVDELDGPGASERGPLDVVHEAPYDVGPMLGDHPGRRR